MSFIEAQSVTKRYQSVEALTDFSLAIPPAEIMALVGPDGAGKTSFIRCVCNLIRPDSGRLLLNGSDISHGFEAFKSRLGYMPQVFSLYPDLTVEENLIFSAGIYGITGREYRRKRDEMYQFSRLAPFHDRRAGALSGGMKQKLALSCALMHNPELLVLDEPTTGVDPVSRRQFWEILKTFRERGVTVLVSTPYMDEVARADRACFVFDGRKLAEGTPDELRDLYEGQIFFVAITPSADQMKQLQGIERLEARRFGAGLHLTIPGGEKPTAFSEQLQAAGVDPDRLKPIEPDLEDCFIQLMERRA